MDDANGTELIGGPEKRNIRIVDYDPRWTAKFLTHADAIAKALGDAAVGIEHIGSTSVTGLAAKPIIDILLIVRQSQDEASYLPILEAAGYILRVREPEFHEHRMLRTPERDVHVHVYSQGCPEIERYLTFRNRMRNNTDDRQLYERIKRRLAAEDWSDMNAYADAKSEVIEGIIAAAHAAARQSR